MPKKLISILLLSSSSICLAQDCANRMQGVTPNSDSQSVADSQQLPPTEGRPSASDSGAPEPKAKVTPATLQDCVVDVKPADTSRLEQTATSKAPQRTVGQPVAHSDFELLAADAAGHYLPVYGRSLFTEAASTFAPVDRAPIPANYVIGPGDEIQLRVWGMVNFQSGLVVDRNGQISIPKVGVLEVAGLQYAQLEGVLHRAIGGFYKDFELNVTMGRLRSIQVFVLGHAAQPGMYTVSSLSTLVDALFASGGPSDTGTMRSIQLRRGGQTVAVFDLYDLQLRGDKSNDARLLPGDVIFIPSVGEQVALIGKVHEAGIYELKGKTTIADAIAGAGGMTAVASADLALLERIEDRRRRQVDQFSLSPDNMRRELHGGDILRIFPISPKFENAVTLRGNVAVPGRFPWHTGMHVSDLIPDRSTLITPEHWTQQNHVASNAHPDVLTSVIENSAEINWEYAVIERLDPNDLSSHLIPFNLGKALDNSGSSDNVELQSGDVVTVFARKDLALPVENHSLFVRVSGEINAPGVYRIKPGQTLREVVQQAGGITRNAYIFGTMLNRLSAQQIEQQQLDQSILQMKRDLTLRFANSSGASMAGSPSKDAMNEQLTMEKNLIDQLSSVHPAGRVVLGLKPSMQKQEDLPDFALEDGDTVVIPNRLNTVQIVGEVYNPNAFRYDPHKTVDQYLKAAGGFTRAADASHIYVLRADGSTINHSRNLWHGDLSRGVLEPGDAIVVPIKVKVPGQFWQNFAPFMNVIGQTAITGAVIGSYAP